MAYRKIEPKLWDDEKIARLDPTTKLVWMYVLTGRHTTSLPGLWVVGVGEIAEGLRIGAAEVETALSRLEAIGRIVRYRRCRLLCVPKAPAYNSADSTKTVRAWFRLWSEIPDCALKYEHLDRLLGLGIQTESMRAAWDACFGTIDGAAKARALSSEGVAEIGETAPLFQTRLPSLPSFEKLAPQHQPVHLHDHTSGKGTPAPATAPVLNPDPDLTRAAAPPSPPPEAPPAAPAPTPSPGTPAPVLTLLPPVDDRRVPAAPGELLAELQRHPALVEAGFASEPIALELLGIAISAAKPMALVRSALFDVAREVGLARARGEPLNRAAIDKKLGSYICAATTRTTPRWRKAPEVQRDPTGFYNPERELADDEAKLDRWAAGDS